MIRIFFIVLPGGGVVTYTYDSNANRITKQTLSGITSFGYDSVNRLVSVSYPTSAEVYSYDRAGNRTAKTWNTMDGTHRKESYTYDHATA